MTQERLEIIAGFCSEVNAGLREAKRYRQALRFYDYTISLLKRAVLKKGGKLSVADMGEILDFEIPYRRVGQSGRKPSLAEYEGDRV